MVDLQPKNPLSSSQLLPTPTNQTASGMDHLQQKSPLHSPLSTAALLHRSKPKNHLVSELLSTLRSPFSQQHPFTQQQWSNFHQM
ncbi:unnamed protein product [Caenorhabditis nigoni]